MGAQVYNRIPPTIRNAPSLICLKNKLKAWLVERVLYSYTRNSWNAKLYNVMLNALYIFNTNKLTIH